MWPVLEKLHVTTSVKGCKWRVWFQSDCLYKHMCFYFGHTCLYMNTCVLFGNTCVLFGHMCVYCLKGYNYYETCSNWHLLSSPCFCVLNDLLCVTFSVLLLPFHLYVALVYHWIKELSCNNLQLFYISCIIISQALERRTRGSNQRCQNYNWHL